MYVYVSRYVVTRTTVSLRKYVRHYVREASLASGRFSNVLVDANITYVRTYTYVKRQLLAHPHPYPSPPSTSARGALPPPTGPRG